MISLCGRKKEGPEMERTRKQMRSSALAAARFELWFQGKNPVHAIGEEALAALRRYAHRYPNMEGSQWFFSAEEAEFIQFRRAWEQWRYRQLVKPASRKQGKQSL